MIIETQLSNLSHNYTNYSFFVPISNPLRISFGELVNKLCSQLDHQILIGLYIIMGYFAFRLIKSLFFDLVVNEITLKTNLDKQQKENILQAIFGFCNVLDSFLETGMLFISIYMLYIFYLQGQIRGQGLSFLEVMVFFILTIILIRLYIKIKNRKS